MAAKLLAIAVGGGVGSVLRWLVAGMAQSWLGPSFPVGTLLVNVIGATLIGFLAALWMGAGPVLVPEALKVGVLVGLLGGFTTFSTYAYETLNLASDRQWSWVAANLLLSNGLALAGVFAGHKLALRLYGVS